ncbi:NAD/NADP transhydrogenase subunit alpha [Rhizobium sp. S152]|uniref:NAD/NADP transhydrogenase subunit alpha n=1 Tax=Rhizobium sp. S152 TaxID=3055038 RepID=UPI0025AA12D7|nr:NAD/NADP transhydrogenase subunit alpha [Rhizobium sp. S152]MDM9627477.1 NAD/NADP transhydrogenase subunit alpha [Rhizobium sp. S152]
MSRLVSVQLGLLRETSPGERRVALTPDDVRRLSARLFIRFEPGCGREAGFADDDYIAAGAEPADLHDLLSFSDMLASVRRPADKTAFKANAIVIYLSPRGETKTAAVGTGNVFHLDLARIAGLRDAGVMDVWSRQAAMVGQAATLEAARELGATPGMLAIDGNFVRPIAMAAIGTGPAGLQALATARRLGAVTHGFGFETDSRRKIERLGAKYLAVSGDTPPSTPRSGDIAIIQANLAHHLKKMRFIITAVVTASGEAPVLLDEKALSELASGTVIVDLAADWGGNCALTKPGYTTEFRGVRIIGSTNLASREPAKASAVFSEGISRFIEHLLGDDGHPDAYRNDPFVRAARGQVLEERGLVS